MATFILSQNDAETLTMDYSTVNAISGLARLVFTRTTKLDRDQFNRRQYASSYELFLSATELSNLGGIIRTLTESVFIDSLKVGE